MLTISSQMVFTDPDSTTRRRKVEGSKASMAEYVKVAQASELEPNHGKLVEVQGKKIARFNVDGKFHAIDNTCTHRGGPLSEGGAQGRRGHLPLAWGQVQGQHRCGAQPAGAARGGLLSYKLRVNGPDIELEL
jgi:nitrite reductase (NADH) small subunit